MYKLKLLLPDLIAIVVILIVGLKFTFELENRLDISLWDESAYLYRGVKLLDTGIPDAQFAPLYSIWYFLVSLFQPDRINLYYLNYKVVTILPPLLMYILLRKNKLPISLSLVVSWLLLLSRAIASWPKVSHFSLILILLIFIALSCINSISSAGFLASLGALLVSYVRPEFFLVYLLLSLFFIAFVVFSVLIYYEKQRRNLLGLLLAHLFISSFFFIVVGSPLSGNRSFAAFGQHFSLNWVYWTGSEINPWFYWQEIISMNFGNSHSVFESFLNNPLAFLRHVARNISLVVENSFELITPVTLNIPEDRFSKIIAGFSFVGLLLAYISRRKMIVQQSVLKRTFFFVLIGVFMFPGIASAIFVYPRHHYLLVPLSLMIVSTAILLNSQKLSISKEVIRMRSVETSYGQLVFLGILMISLTPYFANNISSRPNLNTIRLLQSLQITEDVHFLATEGHYRVYLGDNFQRVIINEKNNGFDLFLQTKKINLIVISDSLLQDVKLRDDSEWLDFLERYKTYGFVQIDVPQTNRKLLIHDSILSGQSNEP